MSVNVVPVNPVAISPSDPATLPYTLTVTPAAFCGSVGLVKVSATDPVVPEATIAVTEAEWIVSPLALTHVTW